MPTANCSVRPAGRAALTVAARNAPAASSTPGGTSSSWLTTATLSPALRAITLSGPGAAARIRSNSRFLISASVLLSRQLHDRYRCQPVHCGRASSHVPMTGIPPALCSRHFRCGGTRHAPPFVQSSTAAVPVASVRDAPFGVLHQCVERVEARWRQSAHPSAYKRAVPLQDQRSPARTAHLIERVQRSPIRGDYGPTRLDDCRSDRRSSWPLIHAFGVISPPTSGLVHMMSY